MRYVWTLMLISLAGCAMDEPHLAPPPPPYSACAPQPVANSCAAPYAPVAYSSPQTQEPPR